MRRVLRLILSLFLFSLVGFGLVNLLPGDPVQEALAGKAGVRQEDVLRLRKLYGLDQPLPVRYRRWMGRFIKGDWGASRTYGLPAASLLGERLLNTLMLFAATLAVAGVLFGLGFWLQTRHGESPPERVSQSLGNLLLCVPPFWLGLMSLFLFGVVLDWFPLGGTGDLEGAGGLSRLQYLSLPALVLAVQHVGQWLRLEKPYSSALSREGWYTAGLSKGLSQNWLIRRRALRLAGARLLSVWAVDLPMLLGAAIITETVFNWPGVARLLYESVLAKDSDPAMACLMFLGLLTLAANQLADILLPLADPRAKGAA